MLSLTSVILIREKQAGAKAFWKVVLSKTLVRFNERVLKKVCGMFDYCELLSKGSNE